MITVGFVKEAFYIAKLLQRYITIDLKIDPWNTTRIGITKDGMLEVSYNNSKIWKEELGDAFFFGIESIDTISRIIACISVKDQTWSSKYPSPESLS